MSRHRLPVEARALLSVGAALGAIKYDDAELARFDRFKEYVGKHGGSLKEASGATGEPVTCQVMAIVAAGHAYNWYDGGQDAGLTLPDFDDFKNEVAGSGAKYFDLVRLAVGILHNLAWMQLGDPDRRHKIGKAMLDLVTLVLEADPDRGENALDLALASHDLLAPLHETDARLAQGLAYRLLVWSKRLPFLADLPPCKFPPPIIPKFPSEVALEICLRFIEDGILGQSLDLDDVARNMLLDPEEVIWNKPIVEIDGKVEELKIEVAFGPELLRWALYDDGRDKEMLGLRADDKIRVLLQLLCENRNLLERHRDDDLSDVYVCAYLGSDPAERTMSLAMVIEVFNEIIRCVIGLSESDVQMNSTRDRIFVPLESELISHFKATIEADRAA